MSSRAHGQAPSEHAAIAARFAGQWIHSPHESQPSYFNGEYPGMEMRIRVDGDGALLVIERTVGEVKDGIALPGSGLERSTWEVSTDDVVRTYSLGKYDWPLRAAWVDDELVVHVGHPPPRDSLRFEERWRIDRNGEALVVERRSTFDGKEKLRYHLYRRRTAP